MADRVAARLFVPDHKRVIDVTHKLFSTAESGTIAVGCHSPSKTIFLVHLKQHRSGAGQAMLPYMAILIVVITVMSAPGSPHAHRRNCRATAEKRERLQHKGGGRSFYNRSPGCLVGVCGVRSSRLEALAKAGGVAVSRSLGEEGALQQWSRGACQGRGRGRVCVCVM